MAILRLLSILLISLLLVSSSLTIIFVKLPIVYATGETWDSLYRLDAEFSDGMEDSYGCYCPDEDAYYCFGGDSTGGGSTSNVALRWNVSEDSNVDPYQVGTVTHSVNKLNAVWYESLSCIYIYGGRAGGTQYYDIQKMTVPGHVITLMSDTYPNEKLPGYPYGDLGRSAYYDEDMDLAYIMVRNNTGDTRVWMSWHNASNHSTGWVDTGGVSFDTQSCPHAVYIPSQHKVWYIGYYPGDYGTDRTKLKFIYTFTPTGDGTTGTWTNISDTQSIECPYGAEGWFTFYNSDNNWIYIMGGCRVATPAYYVDYVWKLSPSNYSIVNLSSTQSITLFEAQDDGEAFYHPLSGLAFLTHTGGYDPNYQYHIDQVNFTGGGSGGGTYNPPEILSINYTDCGNLSNQSVTVGSFSVNWTWDTNYTPSSHLIEIASDDGFSNILIHYNCSHTPGSYMSHTFTNLTASTNKRYIRIRSFYEG